MCILCYFLAGYPPEFIYPYIHMRFNYKPILILIKLPGLGWSFPDFKVPKVSDWGVELFWSPSRTKGDRDKIHLRSQLLWEGVCSNQLSKQEAYSEDAYELGAPELVGMNVTAL